MKVRVDKKTFGEILEKARGATERKAALPVLNQFLIKAQEEEIIIKATNLETFLTVRVEAYVEKEGEVLVPSDKLTAIVKSMPGHTVLMEKEDSVPSTPMSFSPDMLKIESNRSKFKLTTGDPEDFIPFPEIQIADSVDTIELIKAIEYTEYAIAKEERNYKLRSMNIRPANGYTYFAGSDGVRLALYWMNVEISQEYNIPDNSVKVLKHILKTIPESRINIGKDSSFIFFQGEKWSMACRIPSEPYPDFMKIIPESFVYEAKVDKDTFIESLTRVSTVADNSETPVKLHFEDNKLLLELSERDSDYSKDEINIEYSNHPIEIGINPKQLIEGLKKIKNPEVKVKIIDPDSVVVIEPASEEENYKYLIMPTRIFKTV